jgi:hypothetical protein
MRKKSRVDLGRRIAVLLAVAAIIFLVWMAWLGALTILRDVG